MPIDINNLKEWVQKNNVQEITIKSCLEYFENYLIEEPRDMHRRFGDYNSELMNVEYYKIGVFLSNIPKDDYVYIASYAKIYYAKKYMGTYQLVFNLNGEVIDDFWDD